MYGAEGGFATEAGYVARWRCVCGGSLRSQIWRLFFEPSQVAGQFFGVGSQTVDAEGLL